MEDNPFLHPLWTAQRLRQSGHDLVSILEAFGGQLRKLIMQASAFSVLSPKEIEEVRVGANQRRIADLRNKVNSAEEWRELLEIQTEENQRLDAQRATLDEQVRLQSEELESLRAQLNIARSNAELMTRYQSPADSQIAPHGPDDEDINLGPAPGECRFYKKVGSGGRRDTMVEIGDCGCNNWQAANRADKAEKGIEHLEGKSDWRTIQRCASCTGGGVWRVRW